MQSITQKVLFAYFIQILADYLVFPFMIFL